MLSPEQRKALAKAKRELEAKIWKETEISYLQYAPPQIADYPEKLK